MKKSSLYPIFFGLTVLFTTQTSFAAAPKCCTDSCGSLIQHGCCDEKVRDQCSATANTEPQSSGTPSQKPSGPVGSAFGDYSIIQENGVYKAVKQ